MTTFCYISSFDPLALWIDSNGQPQPANKSRCSVEQRNLYINLLSEFEWTTYSSSSEMYNIGLSTEIIPSNEVLEAETVKVL